MRPWSTALRRVSSSAHTFSMVTFRRYGLGCRAPNPPIN